MQKSFLHIILQISFSELQIRWNFYDKWKNRAVFFFHVKKKKNLLELLRCSSNTNYEKTTFFLTLHTCNLNIRYDTFQIDQCQILPTFRWISLIHDGFVDIHKMMWQVKRQRYKQQTSLKLSTLNAKEWAGNRQKSDCKSEIAHRINLCWMDGWLTR